MWHVKIGVIVARFLMNGMPLTQSLRPVAIFVFSSLLFRNTPCRDLLAQETQLSTSVSSSANLSQRLAAAMDARNSGNPAAIGKASEQVLALALAEMAKLRLGQKAYGEAISLCEEALLFEDVPETRMEIALASLYAKEFSEASKQASAVTEMDPQNALAWKIRGEALLESQEYAGASEAFGRALGLNQDVESLYALGVAQLRTDKKQKAEETFSQFLKRVGDSGGARVLVGRAYLGQELTQEAAGEFQKALLLNPATPNAHYFWAIALLQGNGWNPNAEVYAHLRAELQRNPRHFEANYMLGSLASTARNDSESDRYLHLAAEIKPLVPETWVLLGLNAQRRKSDQAAIAYFRRAIETSKDLDPKEHFELRKAYFGLGRLLIASGKAQQGEEMLRKAKELQVQMLAENRRKFAGTKDEGAGMGRDAPYVPESGPRVYESLFSTKISAKPGGPTAKSQGPAHPRSDPEGKEEKYLAGVLGASFNDLATSEALEQKYPQAFGHYGEAARWSPQIPGLQRNLGLAAYFAGKPEEAIRLLPRAIAQVPDDAQARGVLGLSYFASGRFAETVNTLKPMADGAIHDPELRFAWAKSLAETGAGTQALEALRGLEPEDAALSAEQLLHFGQLYRQLGQTERAGEFFQRLLRLEPDNAAAKCALQLSECQ